MCQYSCLPHLTNGVNSRRAVHDLSEFSQTLRTWEDIDHTLKTVVALSNPTRQSLSSIRISLLRNRCLILLPPCCTSRNLYVLWRVLQTDFSKVHIGKDTTYSANFPMLFTVAGGNNPIVSDLTWRLMIACRTWLMFSISSAHSSLLFFTFYAML
jgi:hypothetical protein